MDYPAARMAGCSIQVSPYNKRLQDDALQPTLLRRFGFQVRLKHTVLNEQIIPAKLYIAVYMIK